MTRLSPALIAVSALVAAAAGVTLGFGSPEVRDVAAVRPAGPWGPPIKVSGLAALRKGGTVDVLSVACASAGSCAAGGFYLDRHGHRQGFVAVVRNGVWDKTAGVPGLAALNKGGRAEVTSVSCAPTGTCAAGGYYLYQHGHRQGFVAVERNGAWGKATEVPGLAALNAHGDGGVSSVSCASAGSCAAGGFYVDGHRHRQGFVAAERNGAWGKAIEVPGLGALNAGGDVGVSSVSCASAGSCAVGGSYQGRHGQQGFVAVERNGVWGKAIEMPGPGVVSKGGEGAVSSVSCASAGSCVAGGYHEYGFGQRGFVAVEKNGRWGKAIEMPGPGALNKGQGAQVNSVSCASAGNCAAGGDYTDGHGFGQGFVVSEKNGVWGTAIEVPGLGALSNGDFYVQVSSVSCASAGNCVAGGTYPNGGGDGNGQGFVTVEKNGVWGMATPVPGLAALNQGGNAGVRSVSCASAGDCAVGGSYTDGHNHVQGFAAVDKNGVWGTAAGVPVLGNLGPPAKGGFARVTVLSCASAGNCAAGGYYGDRRGQQGFVVSERNGRWGKAIAVPGLVALNKGKYAFVLFMSCASAGNCVASGSWADADFHDVGAFVAAEQNGVWGKAVDVPVGDGEIDSVSCTSAGNCLAGGGASASYTSNDHGFLVEEQNGVWGKTMKVPGLVTLGGGREAGVNTVSCASASNCVAGGFYTKRHSGTRGFLVVERNGVWGTAIEVPGLGALNQGRESGVGTVSCASAGNCVAAGSYKGRRYGPEGFVAVERNGRWGKATAVPGLATLNKAAGQAQVLSVSCVPAGRCWADGLYYGRNRHPQGFAVSEDKGVWGRPIKLPGLPTQIKGGAAEIDAITCPAPRTCAAGGAYTDRSGHRQGFVTQGR